MAIFSKLILATASVVAVGAAPWEPSSKYSTHGTRIVSRDSQVETYHPENIYKIFGDGIETPLKKRGEPGTIEDSASSFVESQLGIGAEGFKIRSSAATDIGGHVYFQQVVVREPPTYFKSFFLRTFRTESRSQTPLPTLPSTGLRMLSPSVQTSTGPTLSKQVSDRSPV
jgi:hypothetical protein